MATTKLSAKQQQILDFLKEEIRTKGYPPAIREICEAVGLSSTSTVHAHLEAMERKGYIRRSPSKNRSIGIIDNINAAAREIVNVPIVGKVTAGEPILAVENIEDTFPIPIEYLNNDDAFMLKVRGDSMEDAGIYNKDLILVSQQDVAENGDIVVALIEDSATVKTYYNENGHIRLQPENSAYDPIIVKEVSILGKVIGLFRKM